MSGRTAHPDARWLSHPSPPLPQCVACTFRESSKKVINWIMQLLTAVVYQVHALHGGLWRLDPEPGTQSLRKAVAASLQERWRVSERACTGAHGLVLFIRCHL